MKSMSFEVFHQSYVLKECAMKHDTVIGPVKAASNNDYSTGLQPDMLTDLTRFLLAFLSSVNLEGIVRGLIGLLGHHTHFWGHQAN
jgi:hypothetical protein